MSAFDECTLNTCDIETQSIFQYRPSLGANAAFIVVYGIGAIIHFIQGLKWRTKAFSSCMTVGCVVEMIGYGGRIILWQNPFEFTGFILQIICITIAPVFFAAAIYFTLYTVIINGAPELARFKPRLYYIVFIVFDVISLVFQSIGGGMSTETQGSSQTGVNIALFGLSFQVFCLAAFIVLALDYTWRYRKAASRDGTVRNTRFQLFAMFLSFATLCVFTRCVYRIAELSEGYSGHLIHNEGLFIGLEGVLVVLAVFALAVGHPGLVFGRGLSSAFHARSKEASEASDIVIQSSGASEEK